MKQFLKFYPEIKPEEVTVEHISMWRLEVLSRKEKPIKPVTWNKYMRHLKALYNFGLEQEFIKSKINPFKAMFIKEDARPKKTLTQSQLNAIQNFLNHGDLPCCFEPRWFFQALFATLSLTAIRRRQLLKLTIENIDLSKRIITIPAHINKTHRTYKLPIHDLLLPRLTHLISEHKKRGCKPDEQLFNINKFSKEIKNRGEKMSDGQLTHIFRRLSKELGFKISPHRFRHTLASRLMRDPKNIYLVKEILGHTSLAVTLSYIESDPENLRKILNTMEMEM